MFCNDHSSMVIKHNLYRLCCLFYVCSNVSCNPSGSSTYYIYNILYIYNAWNVVHQWITHLLSTLLTSQSLFFFFFSPLKSNIIKNLLFPFSKLSRKSWSGKKALRLSPKNFLHSNEGQQELVSHIGCDNIKKKVPHGNKQKLTSALNYNPSNEMSIDIFLQWFTRHIPFWKGFKMQ